MFIFAKIKCSAGEGGGGLHGNAAMPRTHYLLRLNRITGMKKKRAEWKVKLRRSNFKMHRGELAPRVILAQTYKLNGVLERIVKGGCALSYGTLKHAADLLMNEIEDCLLEGSAVNGVTFRVEDYPYDPDGELQLIGFTEYGFSAYANLQQNFGLYV